MEKPKMSLTEELRKIDHLNGYDKEFTLEESKKYSEETKNRTYDLNILTEEEAKIKYKDFLNEGKKPELLLEFLPAIASGIVRLLPFAGRALASVGRFGARGGKLFKKFPKMGKALGFGKISTKGLNLGKATPLAARGFTGAGGKMGGKVVPGLLNAQATRGLGSLLTWGTGAWLVNSFASGSSTPLPGDAVAGQEDWANGEQPSKEDWMSMCFAPEYYESLVQMDNDDSNVTVTFQSEADIVQIATAINDATEGGEKYFGKGIVDFLTFDVAAGAGTDEDTIFRAFQQINTVGDCSHLAKMYQLKFDVPLIEELYDELDEADLNQIYNILKGKPLAIINGKRIFTNDDLDELLEKEAKEVIERPEGLPAYRLKFNSLFGGALVDVFVGVDDAGTSALAAVFKSGSKDYLGQFQYVENSEEKYFFQTPTGEVGAVTDEDDKAKLAKIFGKADDESDAEKDILILTKDIEVDGTIYDVDENLADIEGPEGTADEYIDELVRDNPTTAKRKPTALQGAAIALAMGVKDFEVLTESITGLAEVLGESKLVVEQKYTVNFDKDDDKYSIRRVRRTSGNTEEKPETTKDDSSSSSSYGVAPTLTAVAAGNGIIKKGMRGDSVAAIQRMLNMSPITGIFNSATEKEVRDYQSSNRLKVDGIVGPETAGLMVKGMDFKGNEKPTPEREVASSETKSTEEEIKNTSGRFSSKDAAEQSLKNLEKINDTKATKSECVMVIAAASKALPTIGGPNTYKVLQYCYAAYNFGLGKETRRVKRAYGIKGDGDLRNKRRR